MNNPKDILNALFHFHILNLQTQKFDFKNLVVFFFFLEYCLTISKIDNANVPMTILTASVTVYYKHESFRI